MIERSRNPIPPLIFGGVFYAIGRYLPDYLHTRHIHLDLPYWEVIFFAFAGLCALRAVADTVFFVIPQAIRYWWIHKPKGHAGTARWATKADLKADKLFDKKNNFFLGGFKGRAVFSPLETSGLYLASAGTGKTTGFVLPALLHNDDSMLVPDLKGTLAVMTAKHRQKHMGHEIIILNPTGHNADILGKTAHYNPVQILLDNWLDKARHKMLMSDARSLAKQLYPEVEDGGRNLYWRAGARRLMVFALLYGIIIEDKPTLSYAQSLLSDPEHLTTALEQSRHHHALNGDFARIAKSILKKLESDKSDHVESFREGALQSLDVFEPSGLLAESTEKCDFRFADLKQSKRCFLFFKKRVKKTVYIIADATRTEDFAPWIGLISWCAITEFIRAGRQNRVVFLCDEASNFRINNLPSFLTTMREYNVVVWIILQELQEWARIYGDKALATLMSQTAIKIMTRSDDQKTNELISSMLGEKAVMNKSYNLGRSFFDAVTRSIGEVARKLKTPEEVRQTDKLIVFRSGKRTMELDHVGYHEIHPWRHQAGINPLFGKKFKGRIKVRV